MLVVLSRAKPRVSFVWSVHSCPQHTHTTHTHLWVSISLNFAFSLSLIQSFPLSHLISIPPSLSVRTGKKQGPPENRNKGNPSIHPSVLRSLHSPRSSPPPHPQPASGGRGGCPPSLCLSVCCINGGGGWGDSLSPCFTCSRMQLSPLRSSTTSVHCCHGNYQTVSQSSGKTTFPVHVLIFCCWSSIWF